MKRFGERWQSFGKYTPPATSIVTSGIKLRDALHIEHLRRHAEFVRLRGVLRFVVQAVLRFAEHHQALLHEAEVVAWQRGQILEAIAAGET